MLLGALLCCAAWTGAREPAAPAFAPVIAGVALQFPRDFGSHPQFGIEWWYVTGWLTTAGHETLGFQITFFRLRPSLDEPNPSQFAAHQLLIAHCAISDPAHAGLWHDQRVRRQGLGLAEAQESDTRVWIDDWQLRREGSSYRISVSAQDFALDLSLLVTQSPMLNGERGFSRKGPEPLAASYYYSQPHLRVSGNVTRASRREVVSGEAWLDHEWSSDYLAGEAAGWDWMGVNLDDGSAVMAFRIRDRQGNSYWSAATVRAADGQQRNWGQDGVEFTVQRRWRSPRTGVIYPVSQRVRVGDRLFLLQPLLDDQENDSRLSSGAIYWEGAVTALENHRTIGRGYLELTGYDRPLSWR
jgi:predicted secreted hydrolase